MKVRNILTVLLLSSLCLCASAQEKKPLHKKSKALSPSEIVDSLEKNSYAIMLVREATMMRNELLEKCSDSTDIIACNDTISRLQSVLAEFSADTLLLRQKSELEARLDTLETNLGGKKHKGKECEILSLRIDSLSFSLKHVDSLKNEIAIWGDSLQNILTEKEKAQADLKLLTDRKGLLDTCVIRIALDALEKPYDDSVQETKLQFELIHPDLQQQLVELPGLLNQYCDFYDEYRTILMDMQDDRDRRNLYGTTAYSNKWIARIKNLSYYKAYYGKGWSIPYLDAKYKELISRLEKHKKAQKTSQVADFTDLLNE